MFRILRNIFCKRWNVGDYNKRKNVKMHRMIAKQFLPGYSEIKPIYHKNGDIFGNHLDKLTYKRSNVHKH